MGLNNLKNLYYNKYIYTILLLVLIVPIAMWTEPHSVQDRGREVEIYHMACHHTLRDIHIDEDNPIIR